MSDVDIAMVDSTTMQELCEDLIIEDVAVIVEDDMLLEDVDETEKICTAEVSDGIVEDDMLLEDVSNDEPDNSDEELVDETPPLSEITHPTTVGEGNSRSSLSSIDQISSEEKEEQDEQIEADCETPKTDLGDGDGMWHLVKQKTKKRDVEPIKLLPKKKNISILFSGNSGVKIGVKT